MSELSLKEKLFLPKKNGLSFIIAGPCSAETENQVIETAKQISACEKVKVFRVGIWKPRTTPGNFEGIGEPAFDWLRKVKKKQIC